MAVLIAAVLVFAMGITVFAGQAEGEGGTTPTNEPAQTVTQTGTITIQNAAKGETYSAYKLFDAYLGAGDAISYKGTIPEALSEYFTTDTVGNIIKSLPDGKTDSDLSTAVQAWGASQEAANVAPNATAVATGGPLTLNVPYGYYAVTSTQGSVVSVDSVNPNPTIYDKNTKTITAQKEVEHESYSIGDIINYTATFDTTNFYGVDDEAKQVIKYTITDTLPEFMSDVAIDSIVITKKDGTTQDALFTDKSFDSEGKVEIDWADEVEGSANPKQWTSKYDSGAKIIVSYHGTLTSVTNINTADTNTVKIQPTVVDDTGKEEEPWENDWEKDAVIKTYAAALKKIDGQSKDALKGAQFTIKGLQVEGTAGVYTVVSYDPDSTSPSATLDTDDSGMLYILGLAETVELTVTEVKAPDGYNKLEQDITLEPQILSTKIYKESGTIKYDAKGNVIASTATASTTETVDANLTDLDANALIVENNKGTELPSTGGIGTTIFYIIGGCVVLAAIIFLVVRSKKSSTK